MKKRRIFFCNGWDKEILDFVVTNKIQGQTSVNYEKGIDISHKTLKTLLYNSFGSLGQLPEPTKKTILLLVAPDLEVPNSLIIMNTDRQKYLRWIETTIQGPLMGGPNIKAICFDIIVEANSNNYIAEIITHLEEK